MAISVVKRGLTLRMAELLVAPSSSIETNIIHPPIPRAKVPVSPKRIRENFEGHLVSFLEGENRKVRKRTDPTAGMRMAFAEKGVK